MTTELAFEVRKYTVKETGTEIRRALRTAFPGVKFSLRGSRGTGYGWFSLSWVDGPTESQAGDVANSFRDSYFDGMADSTHAIPATMYADEDGVIREHRYSCSGVNTSRSYSPEAEAWARSYIDAHGGPETFTDWPTAGYHLAIHRVLAGVDMVGIDWTEVPIVTSGYTGRHVPNSYCVETRAYDWGHEYRGRHVRA